MKDKLVEMKVMINIKRKEAAKRRERIKRRLMTAQIMRMKEIIQVMNQEVLPDLQVLIIKEVLEKIGEKNCLLSSHQYFKNRKAHHKRDHSASEEYSDGEKKPEKKVFNEVDLARNENVSKVQEENKIQEEKQPAAPAFVIQREGLSKEEKEEGEEGGTKESLARGRRGSVSSRSESHERRKKKKDRKHSKKKSKKSDRKSKKKHKRSYSPSGSSDDD